MYFEPDEKLFREKVTFSIGEGMASGLEETLSRLLLPDNNTIKQVKL